MWSTLSFEENQAQLHTPAGTQLHSTCSRQFFHLKPQERNALCPQGLTITTPSRLDTAPMHLHFPPSFSTAAHSGRGGEHLNFSCVKLTVNVTKLAQGSARGNLNPYVKRATDTWDGACCTTCTERSSVRARCVATWCANDFPTFISKLHGR